MTITKIFEKEIREVKEYAAAVEISWNYYDTIHAQQGWTKQVENAYWFAKNRDRILYNLRKDLKSKIDSLCSILKEVSQSLSKAPPSKNLSSQKVLNSIESLQGFLKQTNLARF